jgi:hypothetical protein
MAGGRSTMDKDLRSLIRAIEKVVASDHRIRDKLSSSKHVCDSTDHEDAGAAVKCLPKQAD